MAIRIEVGFVAQTIRMMQVITLDKLKPSIMADIINLCPRFRFNWDIVMWAAAPSQKRNMKTAVIGTSSLTVGKPPRLAVVGA